jgi:hypothetical protein
LGDERGPEGPLFHGGAESVLFTVFEKARFHGGVESVLFTAFGKALFRGFHRGALPRLSRKRALARLSERRASTVIRFARLLAESGGRAKDLTG